MKTRSGIGVGVSSMMVIFVLLCLVTFATLSLVTAGADYRLARSAADATAQYYEADSAAQERLCQIDAVLRRAAAGEGEAAALLTQSALCTVSNEEGVLYASYAVPITQGKKELQVRLRLFTGQARYTVVAWESVVTTPWTPDETLPVFQRQDIVVELA